MAEHKDGVMKFNTGANRSSDIGKPDYEGFLSPLVIKAFGEYMNFNRHLPDGQIRDSDNWQKGIPTNAYMKSLLRHTIDLWLFHRGHAANEAIFTLCAIIFNAQGYLHELLISCGEGAIEDAVDYATELRALHKRQKVNAATEQTKPKRRSH